VAETVRCRLCPQMIRWVTTVAGARMPVDPEPVPDGTVVPVIRGDQVLARVLRAGEDAAGVAGKRYRPHWATCAGAGRRQGDGRGVCLLCGQEMIILSPGQRAHPCCDPD
jgi:hypothetical protein